MMASEHVKRQSKLLVRLIDALRNNNQKNIKLLYVNKHSVMKTSTEAISTGL